jgi:hypothetical protein
LAGSFGAVFFLADSFFICTLLYLNALCRFTLREAS